VAVGIVVSKKVGKAVVRNRVRRRIREALRAVLRERLEPRAYYRQLASFDIMVLVRPAAATADYRQLKAALERALERGQLR